MFRITAWAHGQRTPAAVVGNCKCRTADQRMEPRLMPLETAGCPARHQAAGVVLLPATMPAQPADPPRFSDSSRPWSAPVVASFSPQATCRRPRACQARVGVLQVGALVPSFALHLSEVGLGTLPPWTTS